MVAVLAAATKAAWRLAVPMVNASCGAPVTVTGRAKVTVASMVSPKP